MSLTVYMNLCETEESEIEVNELELIRTSLSEMRMIF